MSRIRTALAAVAVAVATVAALAAATPASAHDTIVSSSPAADSQLTTAPTEVVLTFSNNLISLDENSGTAMTVADESGADWVAGEPAITADSVTVPLAEGMPNGAYTVTWQVVSSDGHPTSGEYSFSVAAPEASATPSASATESAAPEQSAEPSQTAEPSEQAETAPWPLLIGLGAVLLVAIVVFIMILVRRRR